MSQSVTRTGILVGVDGSAESDAAIRWATHEAVMRRAPMTLAHVVAPVVGELADGADVRQRSPSGNMTTRGMFSSKRSRRVQATVPESLLPDVHTETLNSSVVPTLVHASENKQMIVVGSRGYRCARPAAAGLGEYRPGAPCELPGSGHSPRARILGRRCPRPAGHRRVAGLRSGDGAGLRRGITPRGRSGGVARVERRGSLPDSGHGLARVREPGT